MAAASSTVVTTSETSLVAVEHTWTLRNVYHQLLSRAGNVTEARDVIVPSPVFAAGNFWWQLRAVLQLSTAGAAGQPVTLADLHRRHNASRGGAPLPPGVRLLVSLYLCGARDSSTAAATAAVRSIHATWSLRVGEVQTVKRSDGFALPHHPHIERPLADAGAAISAARGFGVDLGSLNEAVASAVKNDTLSATIWLTLPNWTPSPGLDSADQKSGSATVPTAAVVPTIAPTATGSGTSATTSNGAALRNAFYHLLPGAAVALQSGIFQFVTGAYKPRPDQLIFEQCDTWEATFVYSLVFCLCFSGAMLAYSWSRPDDSTNSNSNSNTNDNTNSNSNSNSNGGGRRRRRRRRHRRSANTDTTDQTARVPEMTLDNRPKSLQLTTITVDGSGGTNNDDDNDNDNGDGGDGGDGGDDTDGTDTDDTSQPSRPRPACYRALLGLFRALVVLSWLVLPSPFPLICWIPYMDATKYQTMTIFQGVLFVFIAWGCPLIANKCFYPEEFVPSDESMEWANCECCPDQPKVITANGIPHVSDTDSDAGDATTTANASGGATTTTTTSSAPPKLGASNNIIG